MKLRQIIVSGSAVDAEAFVRSSIAGNIKSDEVAFISFEENGMEFMVRGGSVFVLKSSLDESAVNTIVTNALKDRPTYADLPEPVTVSTVLDAYIDTKIGLATQDLATKAEATPLSEAQVQSMFDAVMQKIMTDGNGNLHVSYTMPTPMARIVTPLGSVVLQDSFIDNGDGTYRYTFDPAVYGEGNYTVEISMS
ncbi:MAG: hypothetical protein EOL93_00695 [Epsilonproteobacteria bacterium]|nr:hypothetical protein [Campylobacterota bacterium]